MEGQDLEGVGDEKTRETDGVEDTKDPDKGDLGVSGAGVGAHDTLGVAVRHLDLDLRVLVDGTGDGPAGEGQDHAAGRDEEEGPTAELVDGEGGADGGRQIEDGAAGGEGKLAVLLGDTGAVVDHVHVVREEGVTGVLRDDTEGDDDGQSPAVALGAEEVEVGGLGAAVTVRLDGLGDLAVLELDSGVVGVAATVVLGEHGKGLLRPVLVDEVSGRLGNPPDTDELQHRGHGLDEGDGSPRPVAIDGGSAPANDGHN